MGHIAIVFSGRHGLFHDFDLWTLRHFFVEEARAIAAEEKTDAAAAVVEYFESWDWQGPGVYVGTDIESFDSGSTHFLSLLLQVFERARRKISSFGSAIPLEYLQAHVNSSAAYFTADQPAERFCRDIDRLIALLKKEPNQAPEPTPGLRPGAAHL